jgi:uncharacterized protein
MSDDDYEIIHSPLTRNLSGEGHTLQIQIYRGVNEPWILEIVDELGTSTVWDDTFDTDTAALQTALDSIEKDGVHNFVTEAQLAAKQAAPELLRKLASLKPPQPTNSAHDMLAPLTDEELDALDEYLLDLDAEESMTLDILDGFLHAIVIGPEMVMPSQWLPKVWGQGTGAMMPPADDLEEANHIVGLVMRHYNSIVFDFEQQPPQPSPMWNTVQYDEDGELDDAEMWAHGFVDGVLLNAAAWQPLLNDQQGQQWYHPIGLLGAEDFSPDQDELTRTPTQRAGLAAQIEDSLLQMHAFWLPLRKAVQERDTAQRMRAKVGRNEPCPCGSGKKFKKCCGAASELH